MHPLSIKVLIF